MSKPASAETLMRSTKRELNSLRTENLQLRKERGYQTMRADKAEKELAEWKARFDILLRREPK